MTRIYFKFSIFLLIFLAIFDFLIHTRPYNDRALRAFLNPSGHCRMPCFMGIQPGVTTMDQAVKLLKASGWVKEITAQDANELEWTWNGSQPAAINHESHGYLFGEVGKKTVYSIGVSLNAPPGEVRWA